MNKHQRRRLFFICFLLAGVSIATSFILIALRQNINVFLTPTQLSQIHPALNQPVRLGGVVKKHSIHREPHSLTTQFTITDFSYDIKAQYTGVLPDLFRENKGVIAEGTIMADGMLHATQVLAKHDENYVPIKTDGNTTTSSKQPERAA